MAISGFAGKLSRAVRYLRRAPAQTASVTSLIVAPVALPIRRMRLSEYDCATKRRDPEIATLSGLGGAW